MVLCHTDFLTWKEQLEKETNSWFVQDCGEKKVADGSKTYYYCNRSGHFRNQGIGKRHSKTQGTSKINGHCTASLTVSKAEGGTFITVEAHTTHYGHEASLGHLRLPLSERAAIAGQLARGVDFQHILDNIRDSLGKEFQRIHLLTRKDITNIEKAYGIKIAQRHADDATSVNMWVEEVKSHDSNPVILYKQQGQPPECDNLCNEDFVLAVQTPLQANIISIPMVE